MGFVRSGRPFPLVYRRLGSVRKQWMAAAHLDRRHRAVGRHQHIQPDNALDVHAASDAGILRNHFVHNFTDACRRFLATSGAWSKRED